MGGLCAWLCEVWPVVVLDLVVLGALIWAARRWNAIPVAADPEKLSHLNHARRVNELSIDVALTAVNDVLERGLKALDALDRKVAFIPPALGVAASIVIPRVNPAAFEQSVVAASGTSALAIGMIAMIAAVAVIFPRSYKAGPDPVDASLQVGDAPVALKLAVSNALARSAADVQKLIMRKADLFLVSVLSLGVTIMLVAIFGIAGGFTGGPNT